MITTIQKPTRAEEQDLAIKAQNGDTSAIDKLTISHLDNVKIIGKTLVKHGVDLEDLIAEGNIGLMEAAKSFKPNMGTSFATWATIHIKEKMYDAVRTRARLIRLPVYIYEKQRFLKSSTIDFIKKNGREPDQIELSKHSGIPLKLIKRIESIGNKFISIHDDNKDDGIALDCPDPNTKSPTLSLEIAENKRALTAAIATLRPKERIVINGRFGLTDGNPQTLDKIATELKITKQAIQIIEAKALKKLYFQLKDKISIGE
jgi:RNA polymerase primary sigma factor